MKENLMPNYKLKKNKVSIFCCSTISGPVTHPALDVVIHPVTLLRWKLIFPFLAGTHFSQFLGKGSTSIFQCCNFLIWTCTAQSTVDDSKDTVSSRYIRTGTQMNSQRLWQLYCCYQLKNIVEMCHIFIICPPFCGHLNCYNLLDIVNRAAINMDMPVFQ